MHSRAVLLHSGVRPNGAYYETRVRLIKAYETGERGRSAVVVVDGSQGFLQTWTFVPTAQLGYLQKQRKGVLINGR